MANKDLRRAPHNRKDGKVWWYEQPSGIYMCVDPKTEKIGGIIKVEIPWSSLRAALKRKDRTPA